LTPLERLLRLISSARNFVRDPAQEQAVRIFKRLLMKLVAAERASLKPVWQVLKRKVEAGQGVCISGAE